ncbi:16205_t:CDS:2, partial [Acaulospora colombiana]
EENGDLEVDKSDHRPSNEVPHPKLKAPRMEQGVMEEKGGHKQKKRPKDDERPMRKDIGSKNTNPKSRSREGDLDASACLTSSRRDVYDKLLGTIGSLGATEFAFPLGEANNELGELGVFLGVASVDEVEGEAAVSGFAFDEPPIPVAQLIHDAAVETAE